MVLLSAQRFVRKVVFWGLSTLGGFKNLHASFSRCELGNCRRRREESSVFHTTTVRPKTPHTVSDSTTKKAESQSWTGIPGLKSGCRGLSFHLCRANLKKPKPSELKKSSPGCRKP